MVAHYKKTEEVRHQMGKLKNVSREAQKAAFANMGELSKKIGTTTTPASRYSKKPEEVKVEETKAEPKQETEQPEEK